MFQVSPEETLDARLHDLAHGAWAAAGLVKTLEELRPDDELRDLRVEQRFDDLGERAMLVNARRVHAPGEATTGWILLAIEDITQRRGDEATIRDYQEKLRSMA